MTLLQLRYVITVAQKGTISEAAKDLFISQPSLTNAIKELEKEISLTIFNRTNKGVVVSAEGEEFLGYARQVLEQSDLLEEKYMNIHQKKQRFCVSTQHYSFAVNAFVNLIKEFGSDEYDFTLSETKTYNIIEDVAKLKSEIGIIYINAFNEAVLKKLLNERNLVFCELFTASPHVFICSENPLTKKQTVTLDDLEDFPYLSFEQGEYNSFYFSEEILSTLERKRSIKVSDRATLFNLLIGLNGYTVSTGVISEDLNGRNIIAIPLDISDQMKIGYIVHKSIRLSRLAQTYLDELRKFI